MRYMRHRKRLANIGTLSLEGLGDVMKKLNPKFWYDPGYKRQIELLESLVKEQQARIKGAKEQLAQFDLEKPEAKTVRASGNIGGISLYFTGTRQRQQMVFQLKEKQRALRQLNEKLKEYQGLLEKTKRPL